MSTTVPSATSPSPLPTGTLLPAKLPGCLSYQAVTKAANDPQEEMVEQFKNTVFGEFKAIFSSLKVWFEMLLGFGGMFVGAFSAYFFTNDSMMDKLSKFLAVGGAIVGGKGAYDFYKSMRLQKEAVAKIEPSFLTVTKPSEPNSQNEFKAKSIELESAVRGNDPKFIEEFNPQDPGNIVSFSYGDPLSKNACALLKHYISDDVIQSICSYSGQEPLVTNVSANGLGLSDFKFRVSSLLAYASMLEDATLTNEGIKDKIRCNASSILGDEQIHGSYVRLLPDGFADVYEIAKQYATHHKGKTDSVQGIVNLSASSTKDQLSKLYETHASLSALEKIIDSVLENERNTDASSAQEALGYKQALVCALGLKSTDGDISSQLRGILSEVGQKITPIGKKVQELSSVQDLPQREVYSLPSKISPIDGMNITRVL